MQRIDDPSRQFDVSERISLQEIDQLPYIVGIEKPHNVLIAKDGKKYINAGDWIEFLEWKKRVESEAKANKEKPDYGKKEDCWFWLEWKDNG